MKHYLTILCFILTGILTGSSAGLTFITQPTSPASIGMGGTGCAIPANDPHRVMLNPASLRFPAGLSYESSDYRIRWEPGMVGNTFLSQEFWSIGYHPETRNYELGITRFATRLKSAVDAESDWQSYDKSYGYALSINGKIPYTPLRAAFGVVDQKLLVVMDDVITYRSYNRLYSWGYQISADDIGHYSTDNYVFSLTPTMGYCKSNIGGPMNQGDLEFPLERSVQAGFSALLTLTHQCGLELVSLQYAQEGQDILVKVTNPEMSPPDYEYSYQSGMGDLEWGDHLFGWNSEDGITLRRGVEVKLLDSFILRTGRSNHDGSTRIVTHGYGFESSGILKLLSRVFNDQRYQQLSNYFGFRYNCAVENRTGSSYSRDNNQYDEYTMTVKNLQRYFGSSTRITRQKSHHTKWSLLMGGNWTHLTGDDADLSDCYHPGWQLGVQATLTRHLSLRLTYHRLQYEQRSRIEGSLLQYINEMDYIIAGLMNHSGEGTLGLMYGAEMRFLMEGHQTLRMGPEDDLIEEEEDFYGAEWVDDFRGKRIDAAISAGLYAKIAPQLHAELVYSRSLVDVAHFSDLKTRDFQLYLRYKL